MTKTLMMTSAACLALFTPAVQAKSLGGLAWSETTPFAATMTQQDGFTIVGTEELMGLRP